MHSQPLSVWYMCVSPCPQKKVRQGVEIVSAAKRTQLRPDQEVSALLAWVW